MQTPDFSRTASTMRASSAGAIEVPVGFDGVASSTPRVAGCQFARTAAASSWKRLAAVVGTRRARAPVAATKWRLHG